VKHVQGHKVKHSYTQ